MTVEYALEELKNVASEFSMVGDAKQAIINNEKYFLDLFNKIKQYYQYITDNTQNIPDEVVFDERWLEACDVIGDIETKNPSLKEWVAKIW